MKKLVTGIIATLILLSSFVLVTPPKPAYALINASRDAACSGVALSDTSAPCDATASSSITNIIRNALNLLSFLAGVLAVIMLIVAGIRFITSQGEGSNTATARNAVLYAIIGLVIVAISQILVRFVFQKTVNAVNAPTSSIRLTLNKLDVHNRDVL